MVINIDRFNAPGRFGVFERLDLVTREEFDIQCAVLLRTREKLEMLEEKLNSAK